MKTDCKRIATVLVALALLTTGSAAWSSASGRSGFSGDPASNGGATCGVCHTGNGAAPPMIGIAGPNRVNAGATQNFFVYMIGGPARTGGVGIAVDGAGELQPFDSALRRSGDELTHVAPKPFDADVVAFAFRYTAPAFNTQVTLHAAGNSSNGALNLTGDGIASIAQTLRIENGLDRPPSPPQPPAAAALEAVPFAHGFEQPVVIANAGDDRLFVVERSGRIRSVNAAGDVSSVPFLDISDAVRDVASEMGLLGLAFHPDYLDNGYFYVYYTYELEGSAAGSRISRFTVSDDLNRADRASERILMEFAQPFGNHNAGDLHFGPDGYLYIASGDGGSGGDPRNFAQNRRSLLGKLLRIDVDNPPRTDSGPDCSAAAGARYSIPPDNAFTDGRGGSGCDEVYALGLRNPWRFSFDRETGDLWLGDVGQSSIEEINYLPAGSAGGLNLGWRCLEGDEEFNNQGCRNDYLPPVHTYAHRDAVGGCSVTGGRVYRGSRAPLLRGQYLFSDFCQSSIRSLTPAVDGFAMRVLLPSNALGGVSAFGEDLYGELYVAELASGTIYKLRASSPEGDIDGDADVDLNDAVIVWFARGTAVAAGDRRDLDGNGIIEQRDVQLVGARCSRPRCAIEQQ